MFLSTNSLSIVYTFFLRIYLFPLISWFVLYLILQAFSNPMFSSTNSLTIVYTFFPEIISLFPLISWFVLYLILQAFSNPMFLSTNSLSIVYTFFPENISLFPLISWFVLYLILQAFTNQNATISNLPSFKRFLYQGCLYLLIPLFEKNFEAKTFKYSKQNWRNYKYKKELRQ